RLIRKSSGRPFSVDDDSPLTSIHMMRFDFGDVVGNIVDHRQVYGVPEKAFESTSNRMADGLPIRPRKVSGRRHRMKIPLAFRRMDRRAGKLAVREVQVVFPHRLIHLRNVIAAYLMAQSARSSVNQDDDSVFGQIVLRCSLVIENLVYVLDFDKMISRSDCPELRSSTLLRPWADGVGIRTGDATAFLSVIEVGFRSHVALNCPTWAFLEQFIEIVFGNIQSTGLADT